MSLCFHLILFNAGSVLLRTSHEAMLLKQSCLIQSHLLHYDFGLSPKLLFQLYSRGAPLCRFLWLYVTYSFAFHFVSLSAYVPDGCPGDLLRPGLACADFSCCGHDAKTQMNAIVLFVQREIPSMPSERQHGMRCFKHTL